MFSQDGSNVVKYSRGFIPLGQVDYFIYIYSGTNRLPQNVIRVYLLNKHLVIELEYVSIVVFFFFNKFVESIGKHES